MRFITLPYEPHHLSPLCSHPSPLIHRLRGRKKSTFQLPPDLGKGLSPADSLRAVLNCLKGQEAYEAETLRFHYMYEYIRTLAGRKPDTLPALVQALRSWAQKSQYPLGEGVAALGEALRWWSQGQYDSALSRAQTALRIFQEKSARTTKEKPTTSSVSSTTIRGSMPKP